MVDCGMKITIDRDVFVNLIAVCAPRRTPSVPLTKPVLQRESEPARGHSWPDDYRQIVNGWWENMPVEMQRAFYEDPLVHRTMVECARQRMTTEKMLWTLAQELFRANRNLQDLVIRMVERYPLPPVQLS